MSTLKKDIRDNAIPLIVILIVWMTTYLTERHFCPMVLITGYPCPGCGLTRAFISLLKLDISSAIEYNPSIFIWILFFAAAAYQRYIRGGRLSVLRIPLIAAFIATIAIYIWRLACRFPSTPPMVYEPDNWLAMFMK